MTVRKRALLKNRRTSSRLQHEVGSEFAFDVRTVFQPPRCSLQQAFPHRGASLALFHSGRAALSSALRAIITAGPKPWRFLLPSYLCPSVLQPFRTLGIAYDFYPVDDRLFINWDHVRRSIDSRRYTGLLFISYFGATGNGVPENLFPDRKNSFVIEDLAQAMLSPLAGQRGDYVVYSPRKFFGLPDGGALVARNGGTAPPLPGRVDGFFGLRLLAFHLRDLYRNEGLGGRERYLSAFREAEEFLDATATEAAMSDFSLELLKRQDLEAARARRRENFAFLLAHWPRQKEVIPVKLPWQPSDVPLGFPVWASSRDAFQTALIQRGIFPPVHWRLPEAVRTEKRYRASRELSEHILTIPCDQRYGLEDMNAVIRAVHEILN